MEEHIAKLQELFRNWYGKMPESVTPFPPSGSERKYYRLKAGDVSAIGAWNPVPEENTAFAAFTKHFHAAGLHVPEFYDEDKSRNIYLIEDLGDTSLFSLLENRETANEVTPAIKDIFKKSLDELVNFQVNAGRDLDYSLCYPYGKFDARSMRWDLNYFKYYFLKIHVPFHEARLEDDFDTLIGFLSRAGSDYFMYRDFQSRNILVKGDQPYFIDYQGGRKGPLQYDAASLLFQVKADLPAEFREEMLEWYVDRLAKSVKLERLSFTNLYYGFVLIRLLQVLGAYGYRGKIERKLHFLSSIPFAMKSLAWWLDNANPGLELPELLPALRSLTEHDKYKKHDGIAENGELTVRLRSFAYRQGLPHDQSGNGGGFVFDCRALPNPGREERYRYLTGRDPVIIGYLKDLPQVIEFLDGVEKLVSQSVDNYIERGFSNLSVNFGCTGGRHRSVYCTETLAVKMREKYPEIKVVVEHLNINVEG